MTSAELRAGLLRLLALVLGLVTLAFLIGVGLFLAEGGDLAVHVGAGFAALSVVLLLVGVAGWASTGPFTQPYRESRDGSTARRRDRERFAAGSLALGVIFFCTALLFH